MKKETTGIMQSYFNLNLLLSLTRMRLRGAKALMSFHLQKYGLVQR